MLGRIEVAYLALLRVVLLVAATVALLVTIGAAATALPALGDVTGLTGHEPIRGSSLGSFIEANKITGVQPSGDEASDAMSRAPLPENLSEASKSFARYDARNGGTVADQSKWDDLFRSILFEKVPAVEQADYCADVLKLSNQLVGSTGKPLSDERVFQLLQYHLDSFLSNSEAQGAARAGRLAGSMAKLLLAGSAFLVFVLVLFSFLFVKIERNLRIRHTPDVQVE